VNLIAVALTCAPLLVSVLDESMCGVDEQAQIHSDPELPMWTALQFSARMAMLVRLIVFLSCAACVHALLLSGLTVDAAFRRFWVR
jgi:hypothetical protein